jgi:hypothetical protein
MGSLDFPFLFCKERANGLRYQRGGLSRLTHIMARNLAKRAHSSGRTAPSGARGVRPFLVCSISYYPAIE